MMVAVVAQHVDGAVLHSLEHWLHKSRCELGDIALLRHPESEQVSIKANGFVEMSECQAEMPKSPDLERAIHQDTANIKRRGCSGRRQRPAE